MLGRRFISSLGAPQRKQSLRTSQDGVRWTWTPLSKTARNSCPALCTKALTQRSSFCLSLNLTQSSLARAGCPSVYTLPEAVGKDYGRQEKPDLIGIRLGFSQSSTHEKAGLKLNIQNTKIMASDPITSWQIDGETVTRLYFLGLQNH